MKSNVVKSSPKNAAENPDIVLERAIGKYQDVLIIGWDKDGFLDARSSLGMSHDNVLWLIEKFKHKLLNGDYAKDET